MVYPPSTTRTSSYLSSLLLLNSHSLPNRRMKLKTLIDALETVASNGSLNGTVASLCTDSRRAAPGALFFALPGTVVDGNDYTCEAVSRGAVAIISERPGKPMGDTAYIQVDDIQSTLAKAAQVFYHYQPDAMAITGITGTNGKTTVAFLVQHMLRELGKQTGMIGTVHYSLGQRTLPAHRTTPGSIEIYGMLEQMQQGGCDSCAMEVSSHGIDQRRIQGLEFAACAFLNLTRDHMDYHQTMEDYYRAKASLFTGVSGHIPPVAVVNVDDSYGRRLANELRDSESTRVITFGEGVGASLRASSLDLRDNGSFFIIEHNGEQHEVVSPLLGRYNVSNLLAAIGLVSAQGFLVDQIVSTIKHFRGVPGRMERINMGQGFNLVVDYAHTDDALANALEMLRGITPGRLIVVFGCGGDRDRMKRPLMTRVVMEKADRCIATADNPRGEELSQIFDDMRKGITDESRIQFIDDRRKAIAQAIDSAQNGDCVLIAGKGHETYQEFAHTVVPFDDRQTARDILTGKLTNSSNKV